MLVKSESSRLPNKNTLPLNGEPMWQINAKKCLRLFKEVYISTDSEDIANDARYIGAIPIKRGKELCGDTPNIEVYKHALQYINADKIVAVQANSPQLNISIIKDIRDLMERGYNEIMTCHRDFSIYGSVWALTRDLIEDHPDPFNPMPEVLFVDDSIDIHTKEDYNLVEQNIKK